MIKRNKINGKYIANHAQDAYTDLGFDYRGKILKKSLSPILFQNYNNYYVLSEVDKMLSSLIDAVKQIKLQYMISLHKNDRNVN